MDVKTLKGIAVVAIEDGEKIGTVSDVLFNIDERRIQGISVHAGSLLSRSHHIIDMASIQSIGSDAVMVPDRTVVGGERSEDRYKQFPDINALTSLRVVTDTGNFVGTVATVRIDEQSGKLTDLEVSPPGISGTFKSNMVVPISSVLSIGKDVAVIPQGNDDVAKDLAPVSDQDAVQIRPHNEGIGTKTNAPQRPPEPTPPIS